MEPTSPYSDSSKKRSSYISKSSKSSTSSYISKSSTTRTGSYVPKPRTKPTPEIKLESWTDMLAICREKDKKKLATIGKDYPPVAKQETVTDNELIKQIASLGAYDHPLYKRLLAEAHLRWK